MRACPSSTRLRSCAWLGLSLCALLPAAAAADPPSPDRRGLPRADVAVLTGWLRGDRADLDGRVYQTWYSAPVGVLSAGFYWTEHVKTEIEGGGAAGQELFGTGSVESVGTGTRYVYRNHRVSSSSLSVTQAFQFLHNTWFHPFAGAGVDFEWERRFSQAHAQTISGPGSSPVVTRDPLPEERERQLRVRAALTAGFKAYFSPRGFIRTDIRLSLASGIDAFRWRIGGGIDF